MELFERAPVAYADKRYPHLQKGPVKEFLVAFVQSAGGLVQKCNLRFIQKDPRKRYALLFAEGENISPILLAPKIALQAFE